MNVDELYSLIISKVKFDETIDPNKLKEAVDLNQSFMDNEKGSDFDIQKRRLQNFIILSKLASRTKDWFNSSDGINWMNKTQTSGTTETTSNEAVFYFTAGVAKWVARKWFFK